MTPLLHRAYNRTHTEVVEEIIALILANAAHYGGIRVRAVATAPLDNGTGESRRSPSQFCFCSARGFPRDMVPVRTASMRYQRLHFLEQWFEPNGFTAWLRTLETDKIVVDGTEFSIGQARLNHSDHIPGRGEFGPFAGFMYEGSGRLENRHDLDQPLCAYEAGLPVFATAYDAIGEWGELKPFTEAAMLG